MPLPYQTATLPQAANAQTSRATVRIATVSQAYEKRDASPGTGRSAEAEEWRKLYGRVLWRKHLRPDQLAREPLCRFCAAIGITTAADTVDHIKKHKGDLALFSDAENLQSLCRPCHTKAKADQERQGYHTMCDARGFPIDPAHPANQQSA